MRRPPLLLTLILALFLGLAPLAPARGAWACPDGTPCVTEDGQRSQCLEAEPETPSCCRVRVSRPCRHGALPGMVRAVPMGVALEEPGDCRFTLSGAHAPAERLSATATSGSESIALLPAALRLPAPPRRSGAAPAPADDRRPSSPSGRSGPARAPPAL